MKVILVARKALAAYLISSAVSSAGEDDRGFEQIERPVERLQHGAGMLAVGADHDPVGPHEILDRRALAQEFGVGGDIEAAVRQAVAQDALDPAAGADRDGRFGHDDGALRRVALRQRLGDLGGGGEDIAQIGMAVAAPRRGADRDEHRVGAGDRAFQIGREAEPPGRGVARHQLVEPGLVRSGSRRRDSRAILPASLSTQVTDTPNSEKHAPETRPT